jgi:hypothetical protein
MVFSRPAVQFRPAPAVPSVPYGVTSVCQDGAATVSWQHPGDNGTAAYTITAYANGTTPGPWARVTAPAAFGTITGLANSTPYSFTVKAANTGGYSAESAQSGQNTPLANLMFGDDFNGSIIDPAWSVYQRDGDQSNTETQYYLPQQASLDGSSHLVLTMAAQPVQAPTYNDANPPGYGGSLVTRPYRSAAVQWAWPGAIAPTWPGATGFTQRGFNFLYGKLQVNAKIANLGGAGWPALWCLGCNCQQTSPLNPDNVGTCSWPNAGSDEIDFAEFGSGQVLQYDVRTQSGGSGNGPVNVNVTSAATTFHTYEFDWSAGSIAFLLDGVSQQSYATGIPANGTSLIIANVGRDTSLTLAQPSIIVDWVRVFHN